MQALTTTDWEAMILDGRDDSILAYADWLEEQGEVGADIVSGVRQLPEMTSKIRKEIGTASIYSHEPPRYVNIFTDGDADVDGEFDFWVSPKSAEVLCGTGNWPCDIAIYPAQVWFVKNTKNSLADEVQGGTLREREEYGHVGEPNTGRQTDVIRVGLYLCILGYNWPLCVDKLLLH